jgi:hypothetical protein
MVAKAVAPGQAQGCRFTRKSLPKERKNFFLQNKKQKLLSVWRALIDQGA